MKFILAPHQWEETIADIEAGGHEYVTDLNDAEVLFFNGSAPEFPELPDNIKVVQAAMAGIDAWCGREWSRTRRGGRMPAASMPKRLQNPQWHFCWHSCTAITSQPVARLVCPRRGTGDQELAS